MKNIYFKNSQKMNAVKDGTVDLIITSPPYFNIKDYAKNGYQDEIHSKNNASQIGDIKDYRTFIKELQKVWKECERVLKPNGKLIINTPLMPMKKKEFSTHYNRHIFDLNSDIQASIIYRKNTEMFLFDTYIWNRTNTSKSLMFGSYPYPRNFYAQNTSEFITIYVKDGIPKNGLPSEIKEKSKLSQKEWVEYTKQIWNIPIPNKSDLAFGKHSAIMPEEIVKRCVRLFSFVGDTVLDPFTGSGTTLKVAKELKRNYIGYEIMENYKSIIEKKLASI
jgi:site-specific DNA-methyltransferase (cytosine-N4-specific)